MRDFRYLKDVVTLKVSMHKCTGCGICIAVCPHSVFEIKANKAVIMDRDACMECGACARNCPTGAVDVRSGVGCATAIIKGAIKGTEPTCGEDSCCCGGSAEDTPGDACCC